MYVSNSFIIYTPVDQRQCTTLLIYSYLLFTGCKDKRIAPVLRDIIQTDYFRVVVVDDVDTVEVCGALKVIGR